MSNYTKLVNFAAKDSLPSGDAAKVIKGTEINTELNNIQTAVNSKADTASPALTGVPTAPNAATGTNTPQIATTAYVYSAIADITSASLALDGYWKDENTGLTVNWGRAINVGANSTVSVSLSQAFSTAGLIGFATYYSTSVSLGDAVATSSLSTTAISVTNGSGATADINWLAIGY